MHRVNVQDAHGTTRRTLFGKEWEPPIVIAGKMYNLRRREPLAGLMFYDDQGDELGGLIYASGKTPNGTVTQGQSPTFDAYRQDQVVQLMQDQENGQRTASLVISDRPAVTPDKIMPLVQRIQRLPQKQQAVAYQRLADEGYVGNGRIFVGTAHKAAAVNLKDEPGRARAPNRGCRRKPQDRVPRWRWQGDPYD